MWKTDEGTEKSGMQEEGESEPGKERVIRSGTERERQPVSMLGW